jgi:hypothetical protein
MLIEFNYSLLIHFATGRHTDNPTPSAAMRR